jgi:diguanylate cyclase (GGDEF)-like protein
MTLVVIAAQVSAYWRMEFDANLIYVVLSIAWFAIAGIGLAHLFEHITTYKAAMSGLIVVSLVNGTTPILHPLDVLHPTWYLVIVLYSYIFFSRVLSLIIMLSIFCYFLLYTFLLMPGIYSIEEVLTLAGSLFVTAALCSAVSRESTTVYERLSVAANTDPLTNLWNRRGVEKLFKEVISLDDDLNIPYSVAVLDLDNFKRINDKLGHEVGDRVICLAADLIKQVTREKDIAARLGGEEFLLILPQDNTHNMKRIAERIRTEFATQVLQTIGDDFQNVATVSVGVMHNIPPHVDVSIAMQTADKLMYEAKDQGRNLVIGRDYSKGSVHENSNSSLRVAPNQHGIADS